MLIIDIIAIALLIVALVIGLQRGMFASLGTLIGLVLGGLAAYWLAPIVNDVWPWPDTRVVAVVALVILLVVGLSFAGGLAGGAIRRGVDRSAPLRVIDRILGGALSVVAAALALTMVSASIGGTGTPGVTSALASSQVLRTIEDLTPRPLAEALAQARSVVVNDALPMLGELLDLDVQPIAPPVALDDPVLAEAAQSVARVSGVAAACGMSATGSGFAVTPDRIVTNAHVVAGMSTALVELPGRTALEGRIVYFDPIDDLAVVAVDGLDARPLPVVAPLGSGTAAVVQGYPWGGPFDMGNAEVLTSGAVLVPDIYRDSQALREIYGLAAEIVPGNSGGPLLTAAGEVAGVVFARAENDPERGYAMTTTELQPVLAGAEGWTDAVSTGRCTS